MKYLSLESSSQYNLLHDIAVLRVGRELVGDYLRRFGYHDVRFFTGANPWHGQWPRDKDRAAAVVAWHVIISALGGADWTRPASIQEGVGIPSPEASAATVRIAKQADLMLANQSLPDTEELKLEMEMLRLEIRSIVDRVIELGDGDIAIGQVKAIEQGIVDVPMSPWVNVAGRVLAVRDSSGVPRWLDTGSLPLPREVVSYHRQKIADREAREGRDAGLEMLIDDISVLSKATAKQAAEATGV